MRGYGNNVLVPVRKNFIAPYDGGIEVSGETVDLKVGGRNYKVIVRENLVPDSVVELEIRGTKVPADRGGPLPVASCRHSCGGFFGLDSIGKEI